ncbi:DNA gyrase subunit A [Mycoplasma zalophi]|uniref:DNA gyrase subunit A n=1 Tax=Mycoplasma zalophi TaxID=191287 RepID=A0ABS6DNT6_9MOLU|nr:DNA gyrase subunit A [Mycoplasma zalophi]MBU4691987.1 DNA gyrase subunit A [Mycoplasma zalophi]
MSNNDNIEEKDLDETYFVEDEEIKKVFEEEVIEEDEEELPPQEKEGYVVKSNILNEEKNGLTPVSLVKEMKSAFIEYAMSVIVSRALPDAKDGLKPVHRRILYGMSELGMFYNQPHKKSARIVGDVLGKYHPHGDSSVYEAMVRMAQDFSLRYPLIDGHGNFGSIDGDEAAAMRYTEARMSKIASLMVDSIKKNTVDFIDNYDASEKEPVVLPARFPNLLVSGTSGIAVGMATSIPPHNLNDVINASIALAANPEISIDKLIEIVQAPDFPTGGILFDKKSVIQAYKTGRGSVTIRSKAHIEKYANGKSKIIVTEIPYAIRKTDIIEKISVLIKEKRIEGIQDFRDESNREGIRIVIDIKKNVIPEIILNKLYKLTQLQTRFSINTIALVNNEPKLLNLKQSLEVYIEHQRDVVTRRLNFDLEKDEQRAHILEGLKIAVENIDKVIEIIKKSSTDAQAQETLSNTFNLTEIQTKAIVDMRLGRLTGLAIEKMEEELQTLIARINEFKDILSNPDKLTQLIIDELSEIKAQFGDKRRSEIRWDLNYSIEDEDLIPQSEIIVTYTTNNYVKSTLLEEYREQKRGGTGSIGTKTYSDDNVKNIIHANTHIDILILTSKAKIFRIRGHEIPSVSKSAKGTPIVNLIPNIEKDENISTILTTDDYQNNKYLLTITKKGIVKRTSLDQYERINISGKKALILDEDDELIDAKIVLENEEIYIGSSDNHLARYDVSEIRDTSRTSRGVMGIKLGQDQHVISCSSSNEGKYIFSLGSEGFGKLTLAEEFRKTSRNAKGVLALNGQKAGNLIYAAACQGTEDLMIITKQNMVIRFNLKLVSVTSRNTKGVKLINLKNKKDEIVAVTKISFVDEETSHEESKEN